MAMYICWGALRYVVKVGQDDVFYFVLCSKDLYLDVLLHDSLGTLVFGKGYSDYFK